MSLMTITSSRIFYKLTQKEGLVESTLAVFIFYLLQRGIGLMKGILFPRLLGPEQYGLYTYVFSSAATVLPLILFGLPSSYGRYVPQYEARGMAVDFFKRMYKIAITISIVATIGVYMFSDLFSDLLYGTRAYRDITAISAFLFFFSALSRNVASSFWGLRFFKLQCLMDFAQELLFTILGISVILWYSSTAKSAISCFILILSIITASFGYILHQYLANNPDQRYEIREPLFYRKILGFSIWYTFTPWIMGLFWFTDRWMINHFLGLHQVGIYSLVSSMVIMLFAFGAIVNRVLAPNLASDWEAGRRDIVTARLNLTLKLSVLTLLGISLAFNALKSPVIQIVFGSQYSEGVDLVRYFLLLHLFEISWSVISIYCDLIEKPYIHFSISIIGLSINVCVCYILVQKYALNGAILSTCFSFVCMLGLLIAMNTLQRMKLYLSSVLVMLAPFVLLAAPIIGLVVYIVLITVCMTTDSILSRSDKIIIVNQITTRIYRHTRDKCANGF